MGGDGLRLTEGDETETDFVPGGAGDACGRAGDSILAWNEMGNFFYDRGMYSEAFKAYEEAVELDPSLFLIYKLEVLKRGMYLVESGSMYPNLRPLDVVTIENISTTKVITWEEGEKIGYSSFNNSGDVICYMLYVIVHTEKNL